VLSFTIERGKIAQVDVVADPARLRELDLAVLNDRILSLAVQHTLHAPETTPKMGTVSGMVRPEIVLTFSREVLLFQ
jgi:hypothetical protein